MKTVLPMCADMAEPQCSVRRCAHYKGVTELEDPANPDELGGEAFQVHWCHAYPSGIPSRIAYGNDEHLVVASDQFGDIVFRGAS